ncbi:MAG: phosphoadenosine phosphosulfate reductase family protein [Turicibacter sp.]|nr:phosphoadenosine phosphosulfate reductase family protein [Turicibacter sp.]
MKQLELFTNPTSPSETKGEGVDTSALDLAVEDALYRIQRDYERTGGKIYLSFSGGKDSTVLAHLIMMANLPTPIPFVFSNTGMEMAATLQFVKTFPYEYIEILKPKKAFPTILKEYGKPCLAKVKSSALNTYHKNIDSPFEKARAFQAITGIRLKDWKAIGKSIDYKIANKDMQFFHPDTEFKISAICCDILKKNPMAVFEKKHQMKGVFTGLRTAEGGVRARAVQTCVKIKRKHGGDFISSTPIVDWTDDIMEQFIERYQVVLSEAYTVYGLKRTGCSGCAFSKNLKEELYALYRYEPNRYKAVMTLLKDVYFYQGVICDFDPVYMQQYFKMKPIIEQRRNEMMYHFRNPMKQKFFTFLSANLFKKKQAEEAGIIYDELLERLHTEPSLKDRFENCYTTLVKPVCNNDNPLKLWSKRLKRWILEQEIEIILTGEIQFEYLKSMTRVSCVKQEIESTVIDCWENEFKTLPNFYLQILSAEITNYLSNHKNQLSLFY